MFDISFWEMSIVAIIALLVIGPERLPAVARTMGHWYGKLQRFITSVKADIEQELKASELKQIMEEQQNELDELKQTLNQTRSELERMTAIERLEEEIKPSGKQSQPTALPDTGKPASEQAGSDSK